jgi:hypothetical protein
MLSAVSMVYIVFSSTIHDESMPISWAYVCTIAETLDVKYTL